MKKPSLWIIGIEKEEGSQDNGITQIFNRTVEEIFPKLKKEIPKQIKEEYRTPSRQNQKNKFPTPCHNKNLRCSNQREDTEGSKTKQNKTPSHL